MVGEFRRLVESSQRKVRLEMFQVNGTTPVINIGSTRATLTDNGAGDWTLTLQEPSQRTPVVFPVSYDADLIVTVGTVSNSAVQILAFDATDGTTPKDGDFAVMVACFDTEEEL